MPVSTKTEDLSCEGFFCISERRFSPHEILECELVICCDKPGRPVEQNIVLCCRVEVVRVMLRGRGGAFGVACRFTDYTIDRQIVAPDLAVEYSL